ncbi:hypothetical protein ACQ4LE_002139 [Meloidogyne hapla]|uniref:HTH La-type RNA-binding domain-containing protein n=1 Tax=Meloidogyne hapla TaxID=6305 RepID=A0A1I8BM29_MELHA
MSEKHPVNSSVTFAKVVSGGNIPNEDQPPLVGREANNSSESAAENEVKSPDDWPSLNVVSQQKSEENKPGNKSTVKKAVNNSKDKTQETTGEETVDKAEEVSALSPSATINSPAGGSKKVSKNSWKKLDIEVDYNTAREVSAKRREMRRDFERRERPQRRNTVCGRDWKEGRGGGNFVGGGRDGRDVGRENNNCSEPVRTTTNFRQNNRAFKDNKFNNYNNNHRRQISKEENENVEGGKNEGKNINNNNINNNREDVQKSPPTNNSAAQNNNNNNEQSQDQSYWYFDDISNGYYYQHSGSQGWKKNSKQRQQSNNNNNTYRPQRQYSPNHGRFPINRQKYFKNSTSTQTEQTNNMTGMNNSQGHRSGGGYQPRSHHHHGGGHRHIAPNNAYKYNNNNKRMVDEQQIFSNSYFCSNNNNCINHHWTTSSLQQLNISGISPTVVTATAVPSAPSTSLLSPNGLIPFPLVVAANTLQTAAVVVATTDQVPTTATTQFTPTIIATQFPQNAIFMAPITTPYVPVDEYKLGELVRGQIEYYFSADNLQKDFFLRRKMDVEGFLPLSLIASFPRIRSLTDDVSFILSCLRGSERIEFSADELKIRPRINPHYWPLHESSPQSGTETPLPATISDDDGNK